MKNILKMAAVMLAFSAPSASYAEPLGVSRVNVTVPFAEGGGSDTLVRALLPYLAQAFDDRPTFLVRNEPGGGGIPGANRFVENAKSDGSDIIALSSSIFLANVLGAPQITFNLDDFKPVLLAPMGPVIYVSPSTGARHPGDLEGIADAQLVFGGGRQDSADMLTVMQMSLLGLDVRAVWGLERGGGRLGFERGEFNLDHQTSAAFAAGVQPLVDAGQAIPFMTVGVIDASGNVVRDPGYPDLPTFLELYEQKHGAPLEGPAYRAWYGLTVAAIALGKIVALPSDAPPEVVDAYSSAFSSVLANQEFRTAMAHELGGYEILTGADAQKVYESGFDLDEEAFAWLADWARTTINFELNR